MLSPDFLAARSLPGVSHLWWCLSSKRLPWLSWALAVSWSSYVTTKKPNAKSHLVQRLLVEHQPGCPLGANRQSRNRGGGRLVRQHITSFEQILNRQSALEGWSRAEVFPRRRDGSCRALDFTKSSEQQTDGADKGPTDTLVLVQWIALLMIFEVFNSRQRFWCSFKELVLLGHLRLWCFCKGLSLLKTSGYASWTVTLRIPSRSGSSLTSQL